MNSLKLIIIVCICALAVPVIALERVIGTKVQIEPPSYLEPTDQFPGFVDREYGTSIMITEIPGPFTKVSQGLNKSELAKQGMTVISKKSIKLGQQDAILIRASQIAYEIAFLKDRKSVV